MQERFESYIESQQLCTKEDKILLGISGGIDSMCLADLLIQSGYQVILAHCNFKLRGDESDGDEEFVTNYAKKHKLQLHKARFDTTAHAEKENISIQMAARQLRYDWFEQIRLNYNLDLIAVAHNADDQLETFFINLTRGTGIRGLSGIKTKNGVIIRPLLFAKRAEIENYIRGNNILFREDSSNASTKYARNKIRHELLPSLEELNPSFRSTLLATMNRLSDVENLFHYALDKLTKKLLSRKNNSIYISIPELKILDASHTVLYELLYPYGFNATQINTIMEALDSIPGKEFLSASYQLIKDREHLILEKKKEKETRRFYVEADQTEIHFPLKCRMHRQKIDEDFQIPRDPKITCIDSDLLDFPLILRKWRQGDYFCPLGMDNFKKVSDFFIDKKIPRPDKEKTWILESNGKIVWISGLRLDNRFKITDSSREALLIELL